MTTNDFDRGISEGGKMTVCTIAINNVWGGRTKDGGHVSSYEKLGYHSGSLEFIRGVLASGCRVVKYFVGDDKRIHETEIPSSGYADLLAMIQGK